MAHLSSLAADDGAGPRRAQADEESETAILRAEVAALREQLRAQQHAATHDDLTGLPNRRAFYTKAAALMAAPQQPAGVMMCDLDGFKEINDTLGHDVGDAVLVTMARRLASYVDDFLTVARLGGDEFAGLLTSPSNWDWCEWTASVLGEALAAPMVISGHTLQVTVSIGLAPIASSASLAEVLRRADSAMYRAKTAGCRTAVWDPVHDTRLEGRPALRSRDLRRQRELEDALRLAVDARREPPTEQDKSDPQRRHRRYNTRFLEFIAATEAMARRSDSPT